MLEGVEPEDNNEFTKYISYLIIHCINLFCAEDQVYCCSFLKEFCGTSDFAKLLPASIILVIGPAYNFSKWHLMDS